MYKWNMFIISYSIAMFIYQRVFTIVIHCVGFDTKKMRLIAEVGICPGYRACSIRTFTIPCLLEQHGI